VKWLWIAAAIIVLAAAAGVWFAFQRPDFVAGLTAVAAGALWKALGPNLLKRKSPEEEAIDRQRVREGLSPIWKRPRPPSDGL
jgi:hypothetical protein